MRIVITLKRDAVAKVVLNNLYKHTQLQTTFGANMLAIVDGVPRTLRLDQFIRYYVAHQIEVIVRRTQYRLRKAEERAHILRGLVKALDALDEVIALIRASATVDEARERPDASCWTSTRSRPTRSWTCSCAGWPPWSGRRSSTSWPRSSSRSPTSRTSWPSRSGSGRSSRDELAEIVEKYGDERRTRIVPYDGDVSIEDLIAVEDVVVTITRTGYAKRTKTDLYRAQRRGGKGVQGAALKQDDIVAHFFVCSTHDWILFFTNKGRVYRAKAYELPEANRNARGQHVANLLAFQPDEQIAQVIQIPNYEVAPYLVLATKGGLVKKTQADRRSTPTASGGIIAINLRDDDELVGAVLCASERRPAAGLGARASRSGSTPTDEALRPMGRATSGVIGMRFNDGDELLSMEVVRDGTLRCWWRPRAATPSAPIDEYPVQGRGGKGVLDDPVRPSAWQAGGRTHRRPGRLSCTRSPPTAGSSGPRPGRSARPSGRPWECG